MEPATEPCPESSSSGYAFITHSQETLPLNLPPSIDNATLARRRRRRTSAHDQAILEEEYRKCDRPDKVKRREITSRVQMGEKEVQIWFQNKRQSTRRKSKPLLPHEIVPHLSQSSSQGVSSQQSFFDSSQSSSEPIDRHCSLSLTRHNLSEGDCPSPQFVDGFSDDVLGSQGGGDYLGVSDAEGDDGEEEDQDHNHQQSYGVAHIEPPTSQESGRNHSSQVSALSSSLGPEQHHLVREISINQDAPTQVAMTTSTHNRLQRILSYTRAHPKASRRRVVPATPSNPPRLLKRSSSIRLSTSLEGKASVVLEDEPSPPPAPLTLPAPNPQPGSVTRSALKRRAIDSKIWELCCDNQAVLRSPGRPRIEPSEATEALILLRKKGGSQKPLKDSSWNLPSTVKSNKANPRAIPSSSPTKAKKSRKVISGKSTHPKPAASSSKKSRTPVLATLQSLLSEPGQDSDKENRPPGAPVSPPPEPRGRVGVSGKGEVGGSRTAKKGKPPRKKPTPTQGKRVLEESQTIPSQSAGASIFYNMPPSSSQAYENEFDDAAGGSQQTFYDDSSQGSSQVLPARVAEMECVENLLSLRGGTWR